MIRQYTTQYDTFWYITAEILKCFVTRGTVHCKINSTNPNSVDLFHEHYLNISNNISRAIGFSITESPIEHIRSESTLVLGPLIIITLGCIFHHCNKILIIIINHTPWLCFTNPWGSLKPSFSFWLFFLHYANRMYYFMILLLYLISCLSQVSIWFTFIWKKNNLKTPSLISHSLYYLQMEIDYGSAHKVNTVCGRLQLVTRSLAVAHVRYSHIL